MRRIFTSTIFVAAFAVASFNSFGQCGGVIENFNNTGGSTAGFSGTTPAGGSFGLNSNKLRFTVPNGGGSFTLTTRTFSLANGASTINYGFALAAPNNASISGTTVAVKYVNTSGTITTSSASSVSGGAVTSGNNTDVCSTVATPGNMSTTSRSFQLIFTFSASGNGDPNFFTIDDYRTSSLFSNAPLPVKFQSLDARQLNSAVALKWNVATEEDLSGYSIERSNDGRNFSQIAFVSASGQSDYSFVDSKPGSVSYYRIKSVDINGRYGYSTVALVKSGNSTIVVKAFPSPVIKNVSIQHPTAVAGNSIIISSADGRVIKTIIPAAGAQQTDVDLSSAKAGLYVVRFNGTNGESETLKILKQ